MIQIAIIGGGIGGLTAAIALRRRGFEPEVFEQAAELLDVGAAIALWPNAMRALSDLDLGNLILNKAGVIEEIRWLHNDGRLINKVRLKRFSKNGDPPSVALHRADLQQILLNQLPAASLHLAHTFINHQSDLSSAVADFSNGKSIRSELLVGADGIHSCVRSLLFGRHAPINRGYTVWRGLAPSSVKGLPLNTAMEVHGSGQRFGLGPVGSGRIGWWASVNNENVRSVDSSDNQAELRERFSTWLRPVVELIESTPPLSILNTEATDRPSSNVWGHERVTLLGDAIHPTTPNLGQGGCMAIEDAVMLARSIQTYGIGTKALRNYEKVRHKRTAAIARYSRYYGTVGQVKNPVVRGARNVLMRLLPERLVMRTMQIVFDYDAGKESI